MMKAAKDNEELRKHYMEEKRVEFEQNCFGRSGKADPGACFALGEWHLLFARDFEKAAQIFRENCYERGHGNSCFSLAQLWKGGVLGEKLSDEEKKKRALELNERACDGGNMEGCKLFPPRILKKNLH